MNTNEIGKHIAFLRKEKKLTQQQLGDKLFVTDKAVSKWERGLSLPDITILEKLASELDTDIYNILQIEKKSNIDIENILISETGMTIKFKSKEYDKIVKSGIDMEAENFQKQISEILSITDKEGNTYKVSNSGTTQEKYEYKLSIDAGINDFTKKLYINYNYNGTKYTEELIEK